jgi:hypothetical protein
LSNTSGTPAAFRRACAPADQAKQTRRAACCEPASSEAGHWHEGDPVILVAFDADCGVIQLAYLLAGLPLEMLGRLRSDWVVRLPGPMAAAHGTPADRI